MGQSAGNHDQRTTRDRRARRVSLRYPERRRGFSRRRADYGVLRTRYHATLDGYREQPESLAMLLALFLTLNVADLVVTVQTLDIGGVEVNPVMAALFETHISIAVLFKLTLGSAVAFGLWSLRRYRRALEASLIISAAFGLVVIYGAAGLLGLSI